MRSSIRFGALLTAAVVLAGASTLHAEPLPSWNPGMVKNRLIAFVDAVTTTGSKDFVPPAERIAVFDNDGTLWSEQPMYFQAFFAFDRVKALAPQHPEWKTTQPFKAVLEDDHKALAAAGERGIAEIVMATHAGMTTDAFAKIVADWLATARHPRFKRPYTDLVFQPMLELLAYLREHGFKTFIVSGGGVEFMRTWADKAYGIPPEQVIGSTGVTTFQLQDGVPTLFKEPKIDFVDDGPGKPVAINRVIGRRPILAFGNSDGDQQMLEWTAAGSGARFVGLVHHTDRTREWAYDEGSPVGKLETALVEAKEKKWTVVDMKRDWKRVFPFKD